MNRLPPALAVLAAAASIAAPLAAQQTQVIPVGLTDTPASATTAWPFGLSSPCRIQYLYAAKETGLPPVAVLQALEVRSQESATNPAKSPIQVQIELSTTPVAPAGASPTFASNRGSNHAIVYSRKPTSFPATSPGFTGTWSGRLLFDMPFLHIAANGNLLIEYDIASQPSVNWQIDTSYLALAVHATVGTGCGGLQATSSGGIVGQQLMFDLSSAPPNALAAILLGQRELPVPVPIPGSAGCLLLQEAPLLLPTSVTPSGTAQLAVMVPPYDAFRAQALYCQFAVVNGGQIATSASRRVILGGVWDTVRIYDNQSNTSSSGTVQQSTGLVTRLHY